MKLALLFVFVLASLLSAADWTTYNTTNSGLAGDLVKAIVIDANGNKWFGTNNGLSAFDGANWVTYVQDANQQTLADNNINDLAFELVGSSPELWIATANGASVMGIAAIDAVTKATPYRTDNTGIINNNVTAVGIDPLRHERWFGTPTGVSRFSSSGWRNFDMTTSPLLAWSNVTSIGVDPDSGWKYIGTKDGIQELNGVARLRTSRNDVDAITAPSPYNAEWSGLWSANIFCIYMDADGSQWYGTDAGFAYHDTSETKAGWDFFTSEEGLVDNLVQAIVRTDATVMWIGTQNGLSKFQYKIAEFGIEVDKFTSYTAADGLAGNSVYDLAVDTDGSLWIATNAGVSHFTGKTAVKNKIESSTPKSFGLVKNYPNPFNPSTTITYNLAERAHVELTIVNMRGEFVRRLVSTKQAAGTYNVLWDGRATDGSAAPTGIYLATLRIDGDGANFSDSIKMLMVK